ncbi:hypothetical protein EW146_g2833 [Bondarzewia mesenterica]|uniref:AP complex mu/sigma subunit domain-containing protein n=1 Tax=Bondarzewia mesenterica TaxID=1095465 RepID=A0A4S4M1R2_9AGAM|nr:hypothetical protein EW146_g2833 [Bondarzewia mesenterica]
MTRILGSPDLFTGLESGIHWHIIPRKGAQRLAQNASSDPLRHDPLLNTSGVPRLTKFYSPIHRSTQTLVLKIYQLISSRSPGLCNFLDAPELEDFLGQKEEGEKLRVVYRSYATLHFVFVVDSAESELGILDLIQVFVESLDRAFENVCELDLVFHFDEVHHILAEIIQGGLVLETNLDEIDNSGAAMISFIHESHCQRPSVHMQSQFLLHAHLGSPAPSLQTAAAFIHFRIIAYTLLTNRVLVLTVQQAAQARKQSFASANPLALSVGGVGPRSAGLQTPLGWLTGKLTGGGAR